MISRSISSIFALIVLMIACLSSQQHLECKRKSLLDDTRMAYIMPSRFAKTAALEFKGIVSDFLYLKIATYIGGKIMNKEKISSTDADFFYQTADVITDLDPWFWDAYLMNSMFLAWDFNRLDLANALLKKATRYRDWDFHPPYHLGFNYYYFLRDNSNASHYLMEAAKRGGGPDFLVPLATRLSVYESQLEPAIQLLSEQLKTTVDPVMRKHLKTRLEAIIILDKLEKKVIEYKSIYHDYPKKLADLITAKLIRRLPADPYGGQFYILPNGRVFTTSELRLSQ
nr:hypothetical protein [uncultured Desulfobacter sp.]